MLLGRNNIKFRLLIMWFAAFLVTASLLIFGMANAGCPNRCSGRGSCDSESQCVCEANYNAAPDCSLSKSGKIFKDDLV